MREVMRGMRLLVGMSTWRCPTSVRDRHLFAGSTSGWHSSTGSARHRRAHSAGLPGNHNNLDYDSEPERTLFRRRRETRRARQAALEQQFNMAANNNDIPIHEGVNQRVTLGQYSQPTSEGCGSTILRPNIQANNFELKPSLIQLVQQDQFSGSY
ncbi:hypothetical protein PIB30_082273 [Stylosanthes scabra]|uniref:Uncharacterized protein n=1 Tax=Stylosanthes scabra TaxID=79078 RepID=A0ABU6WUP8_9FABA|nr:hypothetical protein [Stylosanthes scabra]